MSRPACLAFSIALTTASLLASPRAIADETFNTCVGFIDSLPATISTQGVWCLRKDLSTAISSGSAITIGNNNVTIDCNGFKIGGLAAGNSSSADGIRADGRRNATVRNCNIRGFNNGVNLTGSGHAVRSNVFDNNLTRGIWLRGPAVDALVQGNRVHDTGGKTGSHSSYGIVANGHVLDNVVSGLYADKAGGALSGIQLGGTGDIKGARISDNVVSGLFPVAGGSMTVDRMTGIDASSAELSRIDSNHIAASSFIGPLNGAPQTVGISTNAGKVDFCLNNTVSGFSTGIVPACLNRGHGNVAR